jgi:type VI secretion system protein ImpM
MRHGPESNAANGGVFAIGKFAGHPEFIRADVSGEAIDALDDWLDRGSIAAHERWGPAWATTFPMGAAHGFIWGTPRDATKICGVVAPSRDAVGRDYPLAVVTRVPGAIVARAPHVAPLAFGDFLDAAYEAVDTARTIPMGRDELAARLGRIVTPRSEDVQLAEAEFAEWCRITPLEQAWEAIFPRTNALEVAAQCLDALGSILAPFRGREFPDTALALRLPLGTGGAGAAALWIDVVRRLCRWSLTVPTVFWAADDGTLLLAVGQPPPRAFSELWKPDPTSDAVFDMTRLDRGSSPISGYPGRPSIFARVGPGNPMAAFLDSLVR